MPVDPDTLAMLQDKYLALHEFVKAAKNRLDANLWDYLVGATETETTMRRNRMGIDALAFRPRVLRNVETVDTRATVLGQELRLPVILAPIGSLQDMVASGGEAPTRAAASFGVLHMLSSACAPGMEAVAACNDHPKIFQLYVRGDQAWVDDYVARAVANGYIALCLTVDLDYYGRRERDLAKRYQKYVGTAAVLSSVVVVLASIAISRRLHKGESPEQILASITPEEIESMAHQRTENPKKQRRGITRFLR